MMMDEWRMMKEEWWKMMISSCWEVLITDRQTDEKTDEKTFVIVELLLQLKRRQVLKVTIIKDANNGCKNKGNDDGKVDKNEGNSEFEPKTLYYEYQSNLDT